MFVCISPGKAVSEMTYTVSGGMLNPTHSLTHFLRNIGSCMRTVNNTMLPVLAENHKFPPFIGDDLFRIYGKALWILKL